MASEVTQIAFEATKVLGDISFFQQKCIRNVAKLRSNFYPDFRTKVQGNKERNSCIWLALILHKTVHEYHAMFHLAKVAFSTGNPARLFLVLNLRLIYSNVQKRCAVVLWSGLYIGSQCKLMSLFFTSDPAQASKVRYLSFFYLFIYSLTEIYMSASSARI